MPVPTTIVRLERAVREEQQRALTLARLEWERLAQAVVHAARRRGFAGDDPYLALQALAAVDLDLRRLASALGDLWLTFVAYHGGGLHAQSAAFRAAADTINRRLAQAHADGPLDPGLLIEVVAAFAAAWQQVPLSGEDSDDDAAAGAAAAIIERERTARLAAEQERDGTVRAFAAVLAALAEALSGKAVELPGRGGDVVAAVRALVEDRASLAQQLIDLRQRVAQMAGERRQLLEELQQQTALLARLRAARQRRLVIAERNARTLVASSERRLAEAVRHLQALHDLLPLVDDPARLRSGAALQVDATTLAGQIVAWREAALAAEGYAERWRWALGVQHLARAAPRLSALFSELVHLLAVWRAKLKLSSSFLAQSVAAGATAWCALLPLIAEEIRSLCGREGAGEALPELARVLEPSVAYLARTVAEARGLPVSQAAPAIQEPAAALMVRRLADELWELSGVIEACFAEVIATDFHLPPGELALLHERTRLVALVQEVVAAAQEYGRALGEEPPLPPQPPDAGPDAALAAARAAARWFDVLAVTPVAVGD